MGSGRWRTAVAVLGGSGWGWSLVLPKIREIRVNPTIHPDYLLPLLIVACVVLFLIDLAAIWYWVNGTDHQADQYHDGREEADRSTGGGPGRGSAH